MSSRKRRLFGLVALALVVAVGMRVGRSGSLSSAALPGRPEQIEASGVIGVDEVSVASSQGGKVMALLVSEGDVVKKGQELLSFDTALIDAQIALATAQVRVARAGLKQLEAGAGPATVAIGQAQLEQARAALRAAEQGLSDARALRENPQDLEMQIAVAEAQVRAAMHRVTSAQALKDAAETGKNLEEYTLNVIRGWALPLPPPALPAELQSATWDWWKAWGGLNASSAALEDAQARLAYWRAVRDNPQQLNAQVESADAAVQLAAAGVEVAQAQLDAYSAGASQQQLTAARARVTQAKALLDGLVARRAEMTATAPVDGVVLSQAVHVGEIATAGAALMTVADLSEIKVTVYVAENRLGRIAVKGQANVVVDSFPGRVFAGRIAQIADHAQYTPRNVATKEERVNTVYAVDIRVPNPEGLLKPGMAADVAFANGQAR